ncbi:Gmad2 immunoglobulin-like domain-containing protein [Candidatus Parcubacteria bacterium]|nr:Gmad2 immunoglobulin-like domain-containing protein [Candidatus Parcubacteria bacterium]
MISFFKNYKGSGLIGVLVVIFIVAALVYGGVFFSKNTNVKSPIDAINTLDQAKDDIEEINETTDSRRQTAEEILNKGEEDDIIESEFDEYIITVSNIKAGDNIVSPVVIEGDAVAFENTVIVELRNQEHETMVKEFVTVKSLDIGKSGPFSITLHFDFSSTKEGYVAVYEESAKDGSEVNLVEIPVMFNNLID